ncbi:hypothetical protein F4780DRAFT_694581 [Xylariomycetidae sp. FL0641]|nr:hypothetical protein F4780DRAFT_694581 [Xylariomycetidae sp. FL0641]
MWRTVPIDMEHQQWQRPSSGAVDNERHNLGKPQIFVQLAFGVSWSERHAPRSHAVTYMSRNLKNARDTGNFPRRVPAPTTNYLGSEQPHQSSRQHPHHQTQATAHGNQGQSRHRRPEHSRGRTGTSSREDSRRNPHRDSRESRRDSRGSSAPPPLSDSPWDAHARPSATLFPHPSQASRDQPQIWKALPHSPGQFRLGEDGLPWSAFAWPADMNEDDPAWDDIPFTNRPTTVTISAERPRLPEDPSRVRELESLSTAMMTVDNGFENQWWNQGPRESTTWYPAEDDDAEEERHLSMSDAMLLSAAEPPASAISGFSYGHQRAESEEAESSLNQLVSPLSDVSGPTSFRGNLHRSLTTRSEELWLDR